MSVCTSTKLTAEQILEEIKNKIPKTYYYEDDLIEIANAKTLSFIQNEMNHYSISELVQRAILEYVIELNENHSIYRYLLESGMTEKALLENPHLLVRKISEYFDYQEYLCIIKSFGAHSLLDILEEKIEHETFVNLLNVRYKKLMNKDGLINADDIKEGFSSFIKPLLEKDIFNVLGEEFLASLKNTKYIYFGIVINYYKQLLVNCKNEEEKLIIKNKLLAMLNKLKEVFKINRNFADSIEENGYTTPLFDSIIELLNDDTKSIYSIAFIGITEMRRKQLWDYIKRNSKISEAINYILAVNPNFIENLKERDNSKLFLMILGYPNFEEYHYGRDFSSELAYITEEEQEELIRCHCNGGAGSVYKYLRTLNKSKGFFGE